MRRKQVARWGRAPANGNGSCSRRDDASDAPPPPPIASASETEDDHPEQLGLLDDDDPADPDRPGFHRGVPCPACARKAAIARRHQDRRLWLLARELCASATFYGIGGRAPIALRTLRLACMMLSNRAGTFEPTAPRD